MPIGDAGPGSQSGPRPFSRPIQILEREREERLEAERKAERIGRERPAELEREHKLLAERLERELEQRLEAQRQAEQLGEERLRLRQEHRQLAEKLEQERGAHLETQGHVRQEHAELERERRARQYYERKADHQESQLKKLREGGQESPQFDPERVMEDLRGAGKDLWERLSRTKS